MAVIKRRRGWRVTIGGEQHRGWIPAGAATPLLESVREVTLDIQIESEAGGYLLVYGAPDGSVHGDTWHDTLEGAEAAALESFALELSDWETGEHEDAG
jgi:hypothetical protein